MSRMGRIPRDKLPWPQRDGIYDDDGAECDLEFDGHRFAIRRAWGGAVGCSTGRVRWLVACVSCWKLIHPGSTSATAQMESHLSEVAEKKGRCKGPACAGSDVLAGKEHDGDCPARGKRLALGDLS